MLHYVRLRSLPRPLCSRSLTTLPKPIPTYVKTWNPTAHASFTPIASTRNLDAASQDVASEIERKVERKQLRDTQSVTIGQTPTTLPKPIPESVTTGLIGASRDVVHSDETEIEHESLRGTPTVAVRQITYRLGQRYALERLNSVLLKADSRHRSKDFCASEFCAALWRAYSLAKTHVPALPSLMPDKAWDILWATQSERRHLGHLSRNKRLHLQAIYRDMTSVGISTTVRQRTTYLESIFENGEKEKALRGWEEDRSGRGCPPRHDYKPEHLETGARLYAFAGDVDRAREIMEELFDLYPSWDRSIMVIVFRAHTSSNSARHHDSAKEIYTKMKELKGMDLTLGDYDAWLVGFLEARHLHYAKQVFRDMIKDGHLATSFAEEEVEKVILRLHLLYRLGTDIEKMTSIALQAISTLPRPYHSYVFGDWMKSAVVRKAPEAAAQILDMMFHRDYRAETIHFNLLLKALLRTKDEPRVLKAENIGWRMIEETRKSTLKNRSPRTQPEVVAHKATRIAETVSGVDAAKKVPLANVTTFALMMQHHARNLQWEHVDYLARRLKETDVQPNTAVMNVLMDNQCRQGKYGEAWKTYRSLTEVSDDALGVFPDGASMRYLWKTLRLALGDHATRSDPALPTPRQLLAETIQWWSLCRSRHDAERFRIGFAAADHGAITGLMMHCFSYTQDLPGSLVALHVLRKNFGIFPSDNAALVLQKQTAWVDMHRETDSVRSQYYHSRVNKRNVENMGRIYHILMQRRLDRTNMTGDQFAYMTEEEVGDFGLNLLSEFVRVILKRKYSPEVVEASIDEAKKEVGVPDMATGDVDAFSVA